ncbi:MAG: hypothetical protein R3C58_09855 [Parvularculaceae bacterium]
MTGMTPEEYAGDDARGRTQPRGLRSIEGRQLGMARITAGIATSHVPAIERRD